VGGAPAGAHGAAATPGSGAAVRARRGHGPARLPPSGDVPRSLRGEGARREAARSRPHAPHRDRKVQPRRLPRRPRERPRRPAHHGRGERLRASDAPARIRARRVGCGQRRVHGGGALHRDGPGRIPLGMADGRELRLRLRDPQRVLPAVHGVEQMVRRSGGRGHELQPAHRGEHGAGGRIPRALRRRRRRRRLRIQPLHAGAPRIRGGVSRHELAAGGAGAGRHGGAPERPALPALVRPDP
jgi:hypothetical protein